MMRKTQFDPNLNGFPIKIKVIRDFYLWGYEIFYAIPTMCNLISLLKNYYNMVVSEALLTYEQLISLGNS